MHEVYAATVLAEVPPILGRRLLPFSLWHSYALDAFESPFSTGRDAKFEDVILAVWLCSHTFEECITKFHERREEISIECQSWGRNVTAEEIGDATAKLIKYMSDHTKTPPRTPTPGADLAIPWQLAYYWRLSGGRVDEQTRREVWNLPLPWAVAYVAASAIAQGDDSFLSEDMAAKLNEARQKVDNGNG